MQAAVTDAIPSGADPLRTAFAAYRVMAEVHLKHEEDIMMPLVARLPAPKAPLFASWCVTAGIAHGDELIIVEGYTPKLLRCFIVEGDAAFGIGCVDGGRQCVQEIAHSALTFHIDGRIALPHNRPRGTVPTGQFASIL